jgi:hypothetical protein
MNKIIYNDIYPFKERRIDYTKPVQVYRNLTRKGKVYSIKQSGKVVAFAYSLMLKDVTFVVSHKVQAKVRATGHRQVHAYAKGNICLLPRETSDKLPVRITYNPYHNDNFIKIYEHNVKDVFKSDYITFGENGLVAYETNSQPVNY